MDSRSQSSLDLPAALQDRRSGVSTMSAAAAKQQARGLIVAALGVVYGDIGTSPLYTIRQSLLAFGEVSDRSILGTLSLIAWSLFLVVTVKYVVLIMRADNRGEGGLLVLTALVLRSLDRSSRLRLAVLAVGLVGAALFYGDGIITPAISVLSAIEGIQVATPLFQPYVVPISLLLIVILFSVQSRGTAAVGGWFGPIMLVWFAVLGVLGALNIAGHPHILLALNPLCGIDVVLQSPWRGFVVLGAVFLAVTGTETMYADMGHFGRGPLRTAWLYLVFPMLLLNYFGQGAVLLGNSGALDNPFYRLVPSWGLYPLVGLASIATIIASQAVISGAFSITRQAVQLGYLPRLAIKHTSESEIGQVYVPRVNAVLLVAVIVLVLVFRSSDSLGTAYGIAVSGMMLITTVLAFIYARRSWGWSLALALAVFVFFGVIDATFLGANLLKIAEGGWFPMTVAAVMFAIMSTWRKGRQFLDERHASETLPLRDLVAGLRPDRHRRIPGTAIFLSRDIEHVPLALLHALKHYKVLHERVVLMSVVTQDIPRVPEEERLEVRDLGSGFLTVCARYGFLEEPNILRALSPSRLDDLHVNPAETSFVIGRERLRAGKKRSALSGWRRRLFILMSNNALDATQFFGIPLDRVVELGGQVEI
jgi:KUP system potassium uptake protein